MALRNGLSSKLRRYVRLPVLATVVAIIAGAVTWVHLRTKVTVSVDKQGLYYLHDTHRVVFGSDAVFVCVTAFATLLVSALVLLGRRDPLRPHAIGLGAVIACVAAVAIAYLGALLDGINRGPLQSFPPTGLPVGATALEPARLHSPAPLFIGSLTWLLCVFVASLLGRPRAISPSVHIS